MKLFKKLSRWNAKCIYLLIPSLIGTLVFYIIPFLRVLYYSFIDNQFRKNFVGFDNYVKTITNEYFLLALKNSLLLIIICVPALIFLTLIISLALSYGIKAFRKTRAAFILPMLIPTASIAVIWRTVFNGETVLPVYLLFVWKNIGICVIIVTAALTSIEAEIFEAAAIDGSHGFFMHRKISLPLIAPSIIFSVLLSIVNSFKIFKESYLFYGTNYPPPHSYTLQYYMNNNFLKLDYQALATSSVYTTMLIIVLVFVCFALQRRYSR